MEINGYYLFGFILGYLTCIFTPMITPYILDKPKYIIFFHYKRWYIKQLRYGLFYTVVRNDLLRPKYPLCFMSREDAEEYIATIK